MRTFSLRQSNSPALMPVAIADVIVAFCVSWSVGPACAAEPAAPPKRPGIRAVAFSPDGKLLAAVSGEPKEEGALVVWDVAARKPRFVHEAFVGVPSVAFSPDGRTVAIALFLPTARLLKTENGELVQTIAGHANHVRSVAFSSDGRRLVTGSYDRTVKLWDVASGEAMETFEGHTEPVICAAIAPDGSAVVSCANDGSTRVWDPATGEAKHVLKPTSFAVRHVTFAPDGRHFATCHYDGALRIRDTRQARLRARIATAGGCDWAQFSPDGRTLAVCAHGPEIRLYPVDLSDPAPELQQQIAAQIDRWNDDDYAVREDASAQLAKIGMPAVAQLTAAMESESAEMRIRARRTRTTVWSPLAQAHLPGHASGASSVAFSPDGKWIASGDNAGIVRLWDATTRAEVATLIAEQKQP